MECCTDGFVNEIQNDMSISMTAEIGSGDLTNAIIEQAIMNNVPAPRNLTVAPGPITINQLSVVVEVDRFEMIHFLFWCIQNVFFNFIQCNNNNRPTKKFPYFNNEW